MRPTFASILLFLLVGLALPAVGQQQEWVLDHVSYNLKTGSFAGTNDIVKWLGTLGMLAGRLEIFTLLVLFLPAYWRN